MGNRFKKNRKINLKQYVIYLGFFIFVLISYLDVLTTLRPSLGRIGVFLWFGSLLYLLYFTFNKYKQIKNTKLQDYFEADIIHLKAKLFKTGRLPQYSALNLVKKGIKGNILVGYKPCPSIKIFLYPALENCFLRLDLVHFKIPFSIFQE